MLAQLQTLLQPWLVFLAEDPSLRVLQAAMLLLGCIVVFLVFYTTRDILLRTHSFLYTLFSIVLVAALPIAGFFLYLLIRPARTIKEREMEEMLVKLTSDNAPAGPKGGASKPKRKKAPASKSKKKSSKKTQESDDDDLSL